MRIDTDNVEERKHDFDESLFVGNLPWVVDEEDIRAHFNSLGCGAVKDVRVIRDPNTQIGKGFCYVRMETTQAMKQILQKQDVPKFHNRALRIKRATPPERREKKQKKRDAKRQEKEK